MIVVMALLFLPLVVGWGLWLLFAVMAAMPGAETVGEEGTEGVLAIDILIPAHDEEMLLPGLLRSLEGRRNRSLIDRVVVVADHCVDGTAQAASDGGAVVLERSAGPRGKPAALRDGLAYLTETARGLSSGRAVVILDADCTVLENFVEEMGRAMSRGAKVVQAAYVLDSVGDTQRLAGPATLAFALKNVIRPKGMGRVGIPTQLFGTGMGFRAEVLEGVRFEDHLTEDLKLSHDLLMAGIGPRFVAGAVVRSPLPAERKGMTTQKLRWETGQIQAWRSVPGMMMRMAGRMHWGSVVALLDWSAPPVALAIVYWFLLTLMVGVGVFLGVLSVWSLLLPGVSMALLAAYVGVGALQVLGARGTVRLFFGVPRFFVWKLSLYGRMLTGRGARAWERTERGTEAASSVEGRT